MNTLTQTQKVINYLTKGNTLTAKQANARFGIKNLRARITELRAEGYDIVTESITFKDTGATGVKYALKNRRAR